MALLNIECVFSSAACDFHHVLGSWIYSLYYQLPGAFAKSQQSHENSLIAALIQFFYQAVFTECLDIPIRKTLCVEFGSCPPVPGQIGKPFHGSAGGFFCVVGGVVRAHVGVNIDVLLLIPAFNTLRDLGSSLIPRSEAPSARDRIIEYLKQYPYAVIDGSELMIVSGISEWARRVRELRVQFGWWIYSGVTFKQMAQNPDDAESFEKIGIDPAKIKPDQYVLMSTVQDRDAALRWNLLNDIRKEKIAVKDKIIKYFRNNVGVQVTGEELSYLAKGRTEWARRVRELRTEEGWPIVTKNAGRGDLPVGVYVLEEDRQAYEHDRKIPDDIRVAVLTRDHFSCVECGWNRAMLSREDPRHMLELHHKKHHKDGGENTAENLETLCNVCHDKKHRKGADTP